MADDSIPQMIVDTAQASGVDPRLAVEIAYQESGLDQGAVSPAGAVGVFQLMPDTARDLGVNPYDTSQNIEGGLRYYASLQNQFGDPRAALAAYNWGPGRVVNAIDQHGDAWLDHAPAETQRYVSRILSNVQTQYATDFAPAAAVQDAVAAAQGIDIETWKRILWVTAVGFGVLLLLRAARQ